MDRYKSKTPTLPRNVSKMCFRVTRCCCFSNTKDGSFAVGIYTMIMSLIGIISSGVFYGQLHDIKSYMASLYNINPSYANEAAINSLRTYLIVALVMQILWFLISFGLIYGAKTDNRHFLIPWLIWMALVIGGQFAVFVIFFIAMIHAPVFAVSMLATGGFISFHIYCYSCVYSQYKTLVETQTPDTNLRKF